MTQRIIEIDSPFYVREEKLSDLKDISGLFGSKAPLALEIGCGNGDFIVQLAQARPEENLLAIDIYNKGCYKTCRKTERTGAVNIRVLRLEARYFISRYIGPEQLSSIYINCPDPWPKKRHRRRRLVNREFLELLLYCLSPGGQFYFCTDVADYAEEVTELFPYKGFQNQLPTAFAHHLEDYPYSKYMQRFQEQGLPLYFMVQRKDPACRLATLTPPPVHIPLRGPHQGPETWAKTI